MKKNKHVVYLGSFFETRNIKYIKKRLPETSQNSTSPIKKDH